MRASPPHPQARAAPPPPRPFDPLRPATAADAGEIEALLDAAFGPGRHARTASLLRAGAAPIAGPSLVARDAADRLIGSVQYWPIALVAGGRTVPLTLLGPVAVASAARSLGLGRKLIGGSLGIADAAGLDPILLIGDHSYYGPFGFAADATRGWTLPGPVERERLLLRRRGGDPLPESGCVVALASLPASTAASVRGDDCPVQP